MRTSVLLTISGTAFAAGALLVAGTASSQSAGGPPLRYTMDAATMSGFGAMGAGGSGGGIGAMMSMMSGGAPKPIRMLELRHGASTAPAAAASAQADHFMPQGARLGTSLPLLPTTRVAGTKEGSFEQPSGRLLLYWGCSERGLPGQPVVIDFAKMAKGQVPPGLYMNPVDLPDDWRISDTNSRTYTAWPNDRETREVPASASLLGAHRIASNYSKEINFNLAEDFMPALAARTRAAPAGGYTLAWDGLAKATGYYAWAMGAKDVRGSKTPDLVWWASSKQQAFGGPLWDWISPAGVRRLIAAGTVMPPEQRECAIPAEVVNAAGEAMMVNLQAYGPQADFAYPPRPADAKKPWKPEWIARVRFRSSTSVLPGMDMGGMDEGADARDARSSSPPAPRKPKCRGLKGLAERAAGLCE
ncbi:MAG: hypothetical protein ACKO01_10290 [Erythrobacter sp.]